MSVPCSEGKWSSLGAGVSFQVGFSCYVKTEAVILELGLTPCLLKNVLIRFGGPEFKVHQLNSWLWLLK